MRFRVSGLQQWSGEGIDVMLPEMTNTFHQQSMMNCIVAMGSCSLSHSPSPVNPRTPPILPCIQPPNDSVVINTGDISSKSQPPSSVPVSCGSSVHCDSPIDYGSPYPVLKYTKHSVMPLPVLDPSEVENYSNSESLGSASGENSSVVECAECPIVMECSIPHYVSPCSVVPQGEEKTEEEASAEEESQCTPITTNLFPEFTEDELPSLSTQVPPVVAIEEVELERNKESDLGGFGADGCWYPYVKDINMSDSVMADSFLQTGNFLKELSPESHELDVHNMNNLPIFSPLSFYMSPPPSIVGFPHEQKTLLPKSKPHPRHVPFPPSNSFHHLNLPESILGQPQLFHTLYNKGQRCVEDVWKMHMMLLFKNFRDDWILNVAGNGTKLDRSWSCYKDLAKVRFYCRNCHDGWTSMYGVVIFYYRLDRAHFLGQILYDVSGQKCRKCIPNVFEVPMWYPEEAQKVITNLYYKIATHCYSLMTPRYIRSRRQGQPQTQHNRYLCQGCCQGFCKE